MTEEGRPPTWAGVVHKLGATGKRKECREVARALPIWLHIRVTWGVFKTVADRIQTGLN